MGKRIYGLRSIQIDEEACRQKKWFAEKNKIIPTEKSKLFDKNGNFVSPLKKKEEP